MVAMIGNAAPGLAFGDVVVFEKAGCVTVAIRRSHDEVCRIRDAIAPHVPISGVPIEFISTASLP